MQILLAIKVVGKVLYLNILHGLVYLRSCLTIWSSVDQHLFEASSLEPGLLQGHRAPRSLQEEKDRPSRLQDCSLVHFLLLVLLETSLSLVAAANKHLP